jgi:alkanesulfonate monooxygenase SsuD/methylene tetrahydromethanopterin reductase-like flavin-dependent oxidoreductase (luciferase family)
VAERVEILKGHCADVGRDFGEIEMTVNAPVLIRDSAADAEAAFAALLAANGATTLGVTPLLGSPELVADALARYAELGFTTTTMRLPAPYDYETIDRMPEVAELLAGVGARG